MRVQIITIKRRKKGGVIRKTSDYVGDTVTIGRGTDEVVFIPDLRAAYHHAEIVQNKDGAFFVRSVALSGIKLNAVSVEQGELNLADRVAIGRWEIRRVASDDRSYDLTLELEQIVSDADSNADIKQKVKTTLTTVGPSKRRWSWILVSGVMILFLVLPLLGKAIPGLGHLLKSVPGLPSDSVWNSGELSPVHHFFREDCATCHQKAFIRVEEQACIDCHQNTHAHTDLKFVAIEQLNQTRCASCHEEHNGSVGLVMRDDSFCVDCHHALKEFTNNESKLLNVSDFGDDHPEFKVSIPHLEGDTIVSKRVSLEQKNQLKEQLTLFFSHKAHLKPEGVHKRYDPDRDKKNKRLPSEQNSGDRVVMKCADCHTFDRGNVATKDIHFEDHCAECHHLDFEPGDKQRELPHGDAAEVLYALQQYYQNKALKGLINDPQAPLVVRTRRRPGQRLSEPERLAALAWAERKTREVAMEVFMFRNCKTCHDVKYNSNGKPPWTIPLVRIPEHWMPLAQFTHQKHVTVACDDCHQDVQESEDGSDVLLPSIKVCRDCHAGEEDSRLLASNCVDCHGFHVGDPLLGQQQRQQLAKQQADAALDTRVPDDPVNPASLEGRE